MMTENNGDAGMNPDGEDTREYDPDTALGGYDNPYMEDGREPEGMSFEDSMALKYPLINQVYPFGDRDRFGLND